MQWNHLGMVCVIGVFVGCGASPEDAGDSTDPTASNVGEVRSAATTCQAFTATVAQQVAAGRATATTVPFFFWTITTYNAVGSNDALGSSPTQVVTLYAEANVGFTTNASLCAPSQCGNGVVETPAEQCDGTAWVSGAPTCKSFGLGAGTVKCSSDCQVDISACRPNVCGDGVVGTGEACDGQDLGVDDTCERDLNDGLFTGGTLKCKSDCTYDTSRCTTLCGNGKLDPGEDCDGSLRTADFTGKTCADYPVPSHTTFPFGGPVNYSPGPLTCDNHCKMVTDSCKIPPGCYFVPINIGQLGLQCI